jgi:hypothetical protein
MSGHCSVARVGCAIIGILCVSISEMTIENSGAGIRQNMMQRLITNEMTKVTKRGYKELQFDNSDAILKF